MLTCDIAHNRLLALPDPADLPADLGDHVAGCDRCTRYRVRLIALAHDLRHLPAPDAEAAKLAFLDELTAAGPVIRTVPTVPGRFDWHTLTKPVGGLAAAIAVGFGVWAVLPGKQPPIPEQPLARHDLLQKIVALDTDLSRTTDARTRVAKLTELAEAIHAETTAVYAAGQGKDEMRSLAKMYQKVVDDGIVAQAKKFGPFDPVADRQATLKGTEAKLRTAADAANKLADAPSAPAAAQESLKEMARTAENGAKALKKLAEGS